MLGNRILHPEIDPSVEEEIKVVIEETTTIGIIIDQILEIDQEADGTPTGQVIGVVITPITTDEVIRDHTTDKTHNWLLETEVKVEVEMKTMVMIILEVEVEIEIKGDEKNPGLDLNSRVSTNWDHVWCYRCREYDHFASECLNTLTDEETDYEDADPTSLQMISQDYGPIDSERDYLNLWKARMIPPIFATEIKDRWKSDIHAKQRKFVFDRETGWSCL